MTVPWYVVDASSREPVELIVLLPCRVGIEGESCLALAVGTVDSAFAQFYSYTVRAVLNSCLAMDTGVALRIEDPVTLRKERLSM
jgi:hypothetical protein